MRKCGTCQYHEIRHRPALDTNLNSHYLWCWRRRCQVLHHDAACGEFVQRGVHPLGEFSVVGQRREE